MHTDYSGEIKLGVRTMEKRRRMRRQVIERRVTKTFMKETRKEHGLWKECVGKT